MKTDQRIGFVGVGRMGANMALHLHDEGYEISAVYDINHAAADELATEINAQLCTSLADVTANADTIITVITNDEAMRSIFAGEDDNLLIEATGKVFINAATLSPDIHREVELMAKKAGAQALEAAMASSISQAREGTLYLMVAGDQETFQAQKELLESMSCDLQYISDEIGKAAEVKALVNMVMNINTAGLAEGLGLGKALGLDLEMLCKVFSKTGANSRVLETDSEDMIDRDHECWFSAEHAAKDSGIAANLARQLDLHLPVNNATKHQYDQMVSEGLGELDKSGIAELTFPDRHLA